MTEFLREWILGIVAVSLLSGMARTLVGDAPARGTVRLLSAFALLLTVILPFRNRDVNEFFASYQTSTRNYETAYEEIRASSERWIGTYTGEMLEDELEAQAAAQGIPCEAAIELVVTEGVLVPAACMLQTTASIGLEEEVLLRETAAAFLGDIEIGITKE